MTDPTTTAARHFAKGFLDLVLLFMIAFFAVMCGPPACIVVATTTMGGAVQADAPESMP